MAQLPVQCTMVSIVVLRGIGVDTQMLLARRHGHYMDGTWTYIAGHVEFGETGWQAALRELAEETGLKPDTLYTSSFCEQFYDPSHDCIQVVPAFVAFVADDAQVHLNSEHSASQWLLLDQAAERLPFGSQRDLLAHIRREFVSRTPASYQQVPLT